MNVFLNHPWLAITIGTIFVGVGGWIATWGWNQSSELANRENLIEAVVKEWRINDHMMNEAISLAHRWNKREEKDNFSYRPFKTSRLNALISSGSFGEKYEALMNAAQKYEIAVGDMMAYLRIAGRFNPGIYIKVDLIHDSSEEIPNDESDLLSDAFLTVLKEHRHFGEILSTRYPKSFQKK